LSRSHMQTHMTAAGHHAEVHDKHIAQGKKKILSISPCCQGASIGFAASVSTRMYARL